ncbi:cytochrome c maturation protein CcmE [Micromonospora sp. NPDC052213]|uniref:cytochrome c maturation protein CcmE n=1 Tax=unclassified Micromonospora TaxID=2617518 RepID=UPI003416597B
MTRRIGRIAVGLVGLSAGALLAAAAMQGTLTYYRTPAEVSRDPEVRQERLRVSGQVVPGSLRRASDRTEFRLAEDGHEIAVRQRGVPPETFREGEAAVVEGRFSADGVFDADQVVVRHGNEYRPPTTPGGPADGR